MKKISGFIKYLLFSLCISSAGAFSSKDILSPVSGQWVNVQPLVLNTSDGSEVYYSLSGSDPLVSGFSYDGPVVIDETGDVKVRIAVISKSGIRSDFTVMYTVKPSAFSTADSDTALLIQNINSNPILKYSSSGEFYIPKDFELSLNNSSVFEKGHNLLINKTSVLEHYAACTLKKDNLSWHFVIKVAETPSAEKLVKRSVPFTLDNWTDFTYTGENLIYQIDDEYWTASRELTVLDRTKPHVIRWQSIAYEEGNPVSEYVLPAMPVFSAVSAEDGSLEFKCSDSSYRFALNSDNLYSSVTADTFEGNTLNRSEVFKVYCSNVYQGTVHFDFFVDRQNPAQPVFESTTQDGFARSEVKVKIRCDEEDAGIYYSVSEPVESASAFEETALAELAKTSTGDFRKYDGSVILLKSPSKNASYFKICAYSLDRSGNRSSVAEYDVIIDQYNYYLNSSPKNNSSVHDGSWSSPFRTFEEALAVINSQKSTRVHVTGNIEITKPLSVIERDCVFICRDARFVFAPQSALQVNGASVEVSNCIIERTDDSSRDGELPFITVEKGKLLLDNVEVVGIYIGDGILINSAESEICVSRSGLTVQSQSYACALSASDSTVSIQDSRITSSAPNCVNVTMHGGSAEILSDMFYLIGRVGHCLELAGTSAGISSNTFSLQLDSKKSKDSWLWQDIKAKIKVKAENTVLCLD
ncbi:hypothetical protein DYE49_07750 [Treponema rectale]|uniref:Uncharacterized protein n=1 Tax=Treponema rectale TaxID=744512 RepID=A0A840SAU6_9SPIR|nr:FN3 associated domain-containing protein [Treponema rectale]MBB5217925.1 hypothetical protein [Treponema rectale]QOS40357.1 hypothetical protein DYE49_07750 [Treponema rectale]